MKRFYKLALIVIMMLIFTGCSWNEKQDEESSDRLSANSGVIVSGENQITYQIDKKELNLKQNNLAAYTKQNGNLYVLGYIGDDKTKQLNYSLMILDAEGNITQEIPISGLNNYMVTEMAVGLNQTIWVLANNISGIQNSDDSSASPYLIQIDSNGTVLKEQSLNDLLDHSLQSAQYGNLLSDNQGSIFFMEKSQKGEGRILVLDENGAVEKLIPISEQMIGLLLFDDEKIYVYAMGEDGIIQLYEVHKDRETIEAEGISLEVAGVKKVFGGMDGTVFAATEEGLWQCFLDNTEAVELFQWLDKGINFNDWSSLFALSEKEIVGISQGSMDLELLQITQEQNNSNEEFTILTLASLQADDSLKEEIVVFNQNHDRCAIKLKQYYDPYATGATIEDALDRFNADLLSGSAGDLVDMKSLSKITSDQFYVKRGLLENLYDWMEKSQEINQDLYTQEVWTANEVEGGLYSLIPSFTLKTMMGRTSEVGNGFSWTSQDMKKLLETYPETALYRLETKESFLQYICQYDMGEFVNWETGECDFSKEAFSVFLEYAKSLPDSIEEKVDPLNEIYLGNALIDDELVIDATLSDFLITKQVFGEPVSLMGFPVEEGIGTLFDPEISLAICTQSSQKERAWEALAYFISEEYQRDLVDRDYRSGLPIMEQMRQDVYKKIMEDETQAKSEMGNSYGGWTFSFGYPTEQEINEIETLIHSVTRINKMDQTIYQIITEETAAYFSGQRTLQEVIDFIQNRVSIYVRESM